jgi:hypothetical protein
MSFPHFNLPLGPIKPYIAVPIQKYIQQQHPKSSKWVLLKIDISLYAAFYAGI